MPLSVLHVRSLTQADGTNTAQVHPTDWNSAHSVSVNLSSTEIIRAIKAGGSSVSVGDVSFSNANNLNWGMDASGNITVARQVTLSQKLQFQGLNSSGNLAATSTLALNSTITTDAFTQVTVRMVPAYITDALVGSVGLAIPMLWAPVAAQSAAAFTAHMTVSVGLFSYNGTNIVSMSSGTMGFDVTNATNTRVTYGVGGFTSSRGSDSSPFSADLLVVPGSIALGVGTYWFGIACSFASARSSYGAFGENIGSYSAPGYSIVGTGTASSILQAESGYSATTSAFPVSVAPAGATLTSGAYPGGYLL